MARDGLDGALDYLVQQIQRHMEAQQAELAARAGSKEVQGFLVPRAQKRTTDAYVKLQAAATLYNNEVIKTIEASMASGSVHS